MSRLRGLGELARAYLLQTFRSKTSLFWNFAFPLIWLFLFAFIFGGGSANGVTAMMPGLFAITILAISFAGVSYRLIAEREKGITRRYRATPVRAVTIVLANSSATLVILTIALLLLAGVAWLLFGLRVEGSGPALAFVLLVGAVAFVPLGLVLGSVAPDMRSAPAVANAIFFPLIFLCGAAIPFGLLPEWVQTVGRAIPATYLVEAIDGVMVRGESPGKLAGSLLVLLLTAGVGAVSSSVLFRWESREPVDRRRLGAVLGSLLLFCVGVGWLGPPLGIAGEGEELRERMEERLIPSGARGDDGGEGARGSPPLADAPADLLPVLREVSGDHRELEPGEDRLLRLPLEQEAEGLPQQLLGPRPGPVLLEVRRRDGHGVAGGAPALPHLDGVLVAALLCDLDLGHGRTSVRRWAPARTGQDTGWSGAGASAAVP